MAGALTISCRLASSDSVTAVHSDKGMVRISCCDGGVASGEPSEAYLNEDDARELFNWLGVWLHGGNR